MKYAEIIQYVDIIKERVTCREMLESFGVSVDRKGFAVCPFHNEKTASLKVYDDPKRGWCCHACHAGGDVINLAKLWYGVNVRQAIERINIDFGLCLSIGEKLSAEQREVMQKEADRRNSERKRREALLESAETAYNAAIDAYRENQRTIEETRPRALYEPWSDAFCEALRHQDSVLDELEYTEERWREARAR